MKSLIALSILLATICLAAIGAARPVGAQAAAYTYFPSASTTDGRFLAIAGDGLQTLSGSKVSLGFAAAASTTSLEIGIFDGNTGGNWDAGTTPMTYTLYADPQGNGSDLADPPDPVLGVWSGAAMPDGGWFDIPVSTGPASEGPTGDHFFYLTVTLAPGSPGSVINAFKVRTTGALQLEAQSIGLIAHYRTVSDRLTIYPEWNSTTYFGPTTYNGIWSLFFDVTSDTRSFSIWDGDADHGSFDGSSVDSDDPDTPNLNAPDPTGLMTASGVPIWAVGTPAVPESVAGASPQDDNGIAPQVRRSPAIQYGIETPAGELFWNYNPSGNLEWEQFKISSAPYDPAEMDYHASALSAGCYRMSIIGFDMGNLNAFRLLHDTLGVNAVGDPVKPIRPYWTLGDRVWLDVNNNGLDDNEPGIANVRLGLLDADGNPVLDLAGQPRTAITDGGGYYRFRVTSTGIYTVKVDATTVPGGLSSTTGGNERADEVVRSYPQQSFLGYDFGYGEGSSEPTGRLGDRVWLDRNADGIQDAGEPGIIGAVVLLFNGNGLPIQAVSTGAQGLYGFGGLPAGRYTVEIDPETLPPGVVQSYDFDGGTPYQATVVLAESQVRLDLDFGYVNNASVGDTVWLDANRDGVQGLNEAGIAGVTVTLFDIDGFVVATATTGTDGTYLFEHLAASSYAVGVSSLPPGVAPTYDLDGIDTVHTATFTLAAGAAMRDVDFGYVHTASIGDTVWLDTNLNGVQDNGESGLVDVMVTLLDGSGSVVATATTDSAGRYLFEQLAAGDYMVEVSALPANLIPTHDLDGLDSEDRAGLTLAAGQNRVDADFGYGYLGSLGDTVWTDLNSDGVKDADETGIAGVTVTLQTPGGVVLASTQTDAAGKYQFTQLRPGSYTVVVSNLISRLTATFDLDGTSTPNKAAVILAAGQNREDVDFGYVNAANRYTTYTQGGWGAKPSGNNAGKLLQTWFTQVFNSGVTIGSGNTLRFTTSGAITVFLPAGGTAKSLLASATNPTSSRAGVLAGQLLALQLNLSFSDAGVTRSGLGALVLQSGPFGGYTVRQFTTLANRVLGGDLSALPGGVSISDVNNAATKINESFDSSATGRRFLLQRRPDAIGRR